MGSIRKAIAVVGLMGIGWIGYTLIQGDLSLLDAGIRAAAIFGAVIVLGQVLTIGVRLLASSLES